MASPKVRTDYEELKQLVSGFKQTREAGAAAGGALGGIRELMGGVLGVSPCVAGYAGQFIAGRRAAACNCCEAASLRRAADAGVGRRCILRKDTRTAA
jgi:hypothetical protein